MDKDKEDAAAKIINNCKILVLPDNTLIEDALQREEEYLLIAQSSQESEFLVEIDSQENEEDFERWYQSSKIKALTIEVSEETQISL